MKIAGKILRLAVSLFALAATTVSAVVFTNNTAISPLDLTYDGADITVSNCTVTVDGPHAFASLQVLTGGVVTHSFSANGSITGWINVTDEPQVLSATNPATLLNGNIDAVSYPLTVTDTNHTVVYSNTVDYMLTSLGGGVMQLQLTTNSAIAEGATVFVDYTYLGMISAAGLNLSVTGDVTVAPGGSINANGIGYGGPQGAGAGHHANGSFYDGSGAGYGGNGGSSSSNAVGGFCYGSYSQPANLGSGGGASYAGNGGNGGGSIKIIAGGNIFVDGIISANGADATNTRAGGGSGGSIWIVTGNTNVFAGAGSITANGGAGEPVHGGGGGGGRISLQCFSNNFAGAMAAYGGNGAKIGGAGTIYTKINSNTKQILVDNGGRAGTNTTLAVADNSDVVIRGRAGVMPLGSWTVGNLTIGSNSLLQAFSQIALALTVNGNLTIQPGGSLNADSAGSTGNSGTGAGHLAIIASYYPCGGGGFGGFGASGLGGSGGGSYSTFSFGGAGGGNIQLSFIGTLQVDGTISANGGGGSGTGGGGGSGGMVWLSSGILAGSGNISANGGSGAAPAGGGGGGGRIGIVQSSNLFAGNIFAFGGGGANWGGAETVYLQTAIPGDGTTYQVILDNGGHSGTNTVVQTLSAGNLTVRNGAVAMPSLSTSLSYSSLFIGSNAWLSPYPGGSTYYPLNLTVSGSATIQPGGGIMGDATGYQAGSGPGAGTAYTSGFPGSGAGHGGHGGNSITNGTISLGGNTYDNVTGPSIAGSGGGTFSPSTGGYGGGAMQLTVNGVLQLDGVISANGGAGYGYGGGGSGGAINLSVGTLSGAGNSSANGGSGVPAIGGGGGGGMIAIAFNTKPLTGNISAFGGGGANYGGAGTIYFRTNSTGRSVLLVDNGGTLASSNTPLSSVSSADLTIRNGAIVNLTSSLVFNSLLVGSNSFMLAPGNSSSALTLTIFGDATIQSGGGIVADTAGLGSANGTGAGKTTSQSPFYACSGGGHGGGGGNAVGNSALGGNTYDQVTSTLTAGSGGGGYSTFSSGGPGGGALNLTVSGTLQVNGNISANGGNGSGTGGGGGSGGSISLNVGTLGGAGNISANGGNGVVNVGGGGGGGQIYITFNSNSLAGNISAYGGNGANYGGAGVIYLRTNSTGRGQLIVDNAGHATTATNALLPSLSSADLIVRNAGIAGVPNTTYSSLFVGSNSWLRSSFGAFGLTINNNATIQSGGGIVVDALGSPANSGSGHGNYYSSFPLYQGSGGGHGGYGANSVSNSASGGTTYDNSTQPSLVGSGGGGNNNSFGGTGGGYVRLTVTGSLQLDGIISANGTAGFGTGGGGGSGGGIWITAGTFAGLGNISANGGAGVPSAGGGGGGGRIAITYNTNSFSGNISAVGGGGAYLGGAGTLYFKTNSQQYAQLIFDNGGNLASTNTTFTSDTSSVNVTIRNGAIVQTPSSFWTMHNLLIRSNAMLTAPVLDRKSVV